MDAKARIQTQSIGLFQLGSATFIMGSTVVAGKLAVHDLPPFLVSWARLLLALPILTLLHAWTLRALPRTQLRDCLWPFLEALFGVTLGSVLLLYGVARTTATDAAILLAATPATASLLAVLLLRERLRALEVVGIALAVVSVLAVTWPAAKGLEASKTRLIGNLFVIGAVLAESASVIAGKLATGRLPALSVSVLVVLFSCLLLTAPALLSLTGAQSPQPSLGAWLAVAYYGLIGSVCGSLLWFSGIRKVPATGAALFMAVPPASTLLLAHLLLGEPIVQRQLLGLTCVCGAVACLALRPNPAQLSPRLGEGATQAQDPLGPNTAVFGPARLNGQTAPN